MPNSAKPVLRSRCPIAGALDILGDRWSLLVVRDLYFRGDLRFADLAAAAEAIPTNTLAERLRRLMSAAIIQREQYESRPPRYTYQLTAEGRALAPVLDSLATWGSTHVAGTRGRELTDRIRPHRNRRS